MRKIVSVFILGLAMVMPLAQADDEVPLTIRVKRITLDTALTMARAGLQACRDEGVQVAVTVVDRAGHPLVVLRDVLAPDITLSISRQKAYTALAFASPTSSLERRFTAPFSVGKAQGLMFAAGGVPLRVAGSLLGGVGVSGAPSGELDERCARAAIEAVIDDLEMED